MDKKCCACFGAFLCRNGQIRRIACAPCQVTSLFVPPGYKHTLGKSKQNNVVLKGGTEPQHVIQKAGTKAPNTRPCLRE